MTDMDQLDENLRAMSEPFSARDEKILSAHLEQIRPLYCRMCGQCDGACQKGLQVADTLRILTYADGYRQFALARETIPGTSGPPRRGPLRRLHRVHREVPLWRAGLGSHGPRTGTVCMTVLHRLCWLRNSEGPGSAAWSETQPKPALYQGMTSVMPKSRPKSSRALAPEVVSTPFVACSDFHDSCRRTSFRAGLPQLPFCSRLGTVRSETAVHPRQSLRLSRRCRRRLPHLQLRRACRESTASPAQPRWQSTSPT